MNISYKRATHTTILFGFLFFFIVGYFIIIGPSAYLNNKLHFAINALAIFLVMSSFIVMLLLTNKKERIFDERDLLIQRKANSVGLLLTSMYVFILSIVLFIVFRQDIFVHITWFWFIAYSTFAFAYFSCSFLIVYFYRIDEKSVIK